MTMKDKKNRVMRGKRVGTRPVSANSATELSLGNIDNVDLAKLTELSLDKFRAFQTFKS